MSAISAQTDHFGPESRDIALMLVRAAAEPAAAATGSLSGAAAGSWMPAE